MLGTLPALLVSLVEITLLLIFYFVSGLRIEVRDGWLYAGKAKIELRYISEIIELNATAMRSTRGPNADPAAFLEIRFWVNTGLKLVIDDARDSTPYWLISTSHGDEIKRALLKN